MSVFTIDKNIFDSSELQENSVCAIFAHTAGDGKKYEAQQKKEENLNMIILENLKKVKIV